MQRFYERRKSDIRPKHWINNLDVNTDSSGKTWTIKYCEKDVRETQFFEKLEKHTANFSAAWKFKKSAVCCYQNSSRKIKKYYRSFCFWTDGRLGHLAGIRTRKEAIVSGPGINLIYQRERFPEFPGRRNPSRGRNFSPNVPRRYCTRGRGGNSAKSARWKTTEGERVRKKETGRLSFVWCETAGRIWHGTIQFH